MICFGAETDQELKEKGLVDPTFNKIKKNKNKNIQISYVVLDRETGRMFYFFYIIFFFFSHFSLRFTEIGPSEFVGGRSKVLYSTRATRGNQKHGISPSLYLKFGKSPVLVFLRSSAFYRSELVGAEG